MERRRRGRTPASSTNALLALGVRNKRIDTAIERLTSFWTTEQGWFCHYFFVHGMFKKTHAGRPMAGLVDHLPVLANPEKVV